MEEKLTVDHQKIIAQRWEQESKKVGPFKLLAQVILGELLIGVYRPDLPGLNPDLINYVELIRLQNGQVSLTFDHEGKPDVVSYKQEDVTQNNEQKMQQMEVQVESYIQEYLKEHPEKKVSEENLEELVQLLMGSLYISRTFGMVTFDWEVTAEQVEFTLRKLI